MKWIEVKWLCAGMCVCTVLAAGRAAVEQSIEQKQIPVSAETIAAEASEAEAYEINAPEMEISETVASEIAILEADGMELDAVPQAEAEQREIHRNGFGSGAEESNLIIADVSNYVNIRSVPGEEGEILGKLYANSVGRRYGEENGWYYMESGKVKGYVKAEFVLTGEAAELRAKETGTRLAEVTTTTLKVREEADIQAKVLGLVPGGDILNVLEELEGWIKVDTEEGPGYVSADYVNVYTENTEAESREEEEARKKAEEERKKAEEARKKAEAAAKEAAKKQQEKKPSGKPASNSQSGLSADNSTDRNSYHNSVTTETNVTGEVSGMERGRKIAEYAKQFIGNPYVYGGTSLTNGADCSGFVQSVYKHFGISLPRTSGEQGKAGTAVAGLSDAKPGDLVWYSGHIGIYIGDGKVIHASNPKNGIIISDANYRTILGIRRII